MDNDFIEDSWGNEYEEIAMASTYFGVSQTNILLIGILRQLKEMNRLLYNKWEAQI